MNKKLIVVCLIVFLGIVLFPTNLIGDPTLEKKTDHGENDGNLYYSNPNAYCIMTTVTPFGTTTTEGTRTECFSGGDSYCIATDCQ